MPQRNILLTFLNLIILDNRQNYLRSLMHEISGQDNKDT